jgi:hypothetical protein
MAYSKMIGVDRVKALLKAITPAMEEELDAVLEGEAEDLAAAIRRVVPEQTGALLRSIRVERVPNRRLSWRVKVGGVPETRKKVRKGVKDADFQKAKISGGFGGEFDYTLAVEFGHLAVDGSHVPAEPFVMPTWRARQRGIRNRLNRAARKVFDTRASKG